MPRSFPSAKRRAASSALPVTPGTSSRPAAAIASIAPCPRFPRIRVWTPKLFRYGGRAWCPFSPLPVTSDETTFPSSIS